MREANSARLLPRPKLRDALLLLVLTATSVLLHGYHYGHQDAAVWLPPIKKLLDPSLYPYDATFFLAQTHLTLFPELIAFSLKLTRLPVDLGVFLWHLLTIFLVLLGCWRLSRRCFTRPATQWAAVATVWAAHLMTATGSKISLMDRYLHPRDLVTAAVLFTLVAVLDRQIRALAWLAGAAVIHPTMTIFGALHLAVQRWKLPRESLAVLMVLPLAIFAPISNPAWREALGARTFLLPLRWHWYEWLGVVVPLVMLSWFAQVARRSAAKSAAGSPIRPVVEHICRRVVVAGLLGVAGSILISTVPALERFIPTEPMRTLHFVYLMWIFMGGGLLGEYALRDRPGRWLLLLLPLCTAFYLANRLVCPTSPHIEWPG